MLGYWPPMLYFVFILLSTLRLDFWLSLWTGAVAAVQLLALAAWLLPIELFSEMPERALAYNLSRSVVLLACGIIAGIVAGSLRRQFEASVAAAAARDRVTNLFGQHVSPAVVDRLLATLTDPPSEMRRVCVLFLDIRGFTAMSRVRAADATVALLNDFFAEMIEIVDQHNGIINKFLGDGFLALFGAPLEDPKAAVQCAGRGARHAGRGRCLEQGAARQCAARRHRHPYRRGGDRHRGLAATQGIHGDRRHREPRGASRAAHQGDRRAAPHLELGARGDDRRRRCDRSRPAARSAVTTRRSGCGGWRELVLRLRLEHERRSACSRNG